MTLRSVSSVGSGRRPYPVIEYSRRDAVGSGRGMTIDQQYRMATSDPCPIVCASSHRAGGKMIAVKVLMLDDSQTIFQIQEKAAGKLLFQQVCKQLNLLEEDYFGLEYEDRDHRTKYWVDLEKPVNHQLGVSSLADVLVSFVVKFYTPDPSQLEEEFTRYLFCLQIKRDLYRGDLLVNENTAAVLASYIVQASCGDFSEEDYPNSSYLSSYRFVPQQDPDLERKIMEYHRRHVGLCPAEADINLLETARRCEYYGVKLTPVRLTSKGVEGVPCLLSVAYNGVGVYQNQTKINTFTWAKMRKISFHRRKFLVKLYREARPSAVHRRDVVEFLFPGRDEAKNFWKKCVEHHAFFRCLKLKAEERKRRKSLLFSRGSSFRYSGRTQQEMVEYVRENFVSRQSFKTSYSTPGRRSQSHSFRSHSASPLNASGQPATTSVSAHPLLPVMGSPSNDSRVSLNVLQGHYAQIGPVSAAQSRSLPDSPVRKAEAVTPPTRRSGSAGGGSLKRRSGAGGDRPPTPPPPYQPPPAQAERPKSIEIRAQEMQQQRYSSLAPESSEENSGEAAQGTLSPLSEAISSSSPTPIPTHNINMAAAEDFPPPPVPPAQGKAAAGLSEAEVTPGRRRLEAHNTTDPSYFMSKEMLMTERTFKKDLEILTIAFRGEVEDSDEFCQHPVLCAIFDALDPLVAFHSALLREMERRISLWSMGEIQHDSDPSVPGIERCLCDNLHYLIHHHRSFVAVHFRLISDLEDMVSTSPSFRQLWKKFDSAKICYLPLNQLLIKPLHRILHYELLLDRLARHYEETGIGDAGTCWKCLRELRGLTITLEEALPATLNMLKLSELSRECEGFEELQLTNTNVSRRWFIREGALMKWSRYGFSQRLFFLFSDVLVYTNRLKPSTTASTGGGHVGLGEHPPYSFKVHGTQPLIGLAIEDSPVDYQKDETNVFTLYGTNRTMKLQAPSLGDKARWVRDIENAIADAESRGDFVAPEIAQFSAQGVGGQYSLLRNSVSQEEVSSGGDGAGSPETIGGGAGVAPSAAFPAPRSNTSLHVCWHRATTMNHLDHKLALQVHLSGYLLRKFKNSAGWQKLWVVFTNFCLFFYKNWQDSVPLASLPLLGYAVSPAALSDNINKELVFKLSYKSHVYFFRAESAFTFGRWLEVLSLVTDEEV
ncbi:unnamed protein product [Cyprideis torosa]|uniref:Moesin/ezrin/radixin homolog 1 n=1 Tax=Cyprideis torosa TaxID=163714 RepID=A0A7R8WNQ8_9CRUS|nr:unnamed protein product [Cyprideis torosa]CAG0900712.1 unnamed protein product [Cyprideis torosa]